MANDDVTIVMPLEDYSFLVGFHPDRDRTASRADMVSVIEHMQEVLERGVRSNGS